MAVLQSKSLSQEELFFGLMKVLVGKFEEKQVDSYIIERFVREVPTKGDWQENEPTGWEEVRILFKPKK